MLKKIKKAFNDSGELKLKMAQDEDFMNNIKIIAEVITAAYRRGNKVLAAGNGGSAADAQHFIAEFVGRFYYDRPSLPGIALTTDTSILTAIGNDYGYDDIFARQIAGNGVKGDVFLGISTSGNSTNIINAMKTAKAGGIVTIGLTGAKKGQMDDICDFIVKIPSTDTPRIQEGHLLVEHVICQIVEEEIFPRNEVF